MHATVYIFRVLNSNPQAFRQLTLSFTQNISKHSFEMADELSLPRLAWDPAAKSISNDRPRKRVRLSSPPISSDSALFSSDDDPSSENYTPGRRKQKYRGPWYSQQPASDHDSQESQAHEHPKKGKRSFERQFDSGVWLGSDGTDSDETIESVQFINETWRLPVRPSRSTQTKDEPPSPEQLARSQVELCLEEGNESIDLSYGTHLYSQNRRLTDYPQISRLNLPFKCNYPTSGGIFLCPTCHRRCLLSN
jgi:hypothetical protein